MQCPRLDHFLRLNDDGSVGKCGHMIGAPGWTSWHAMQTSEWLHGIRADIENDRWPDECQRCRDSEQIGTKSIRQAALDRHRILSLIKQDYLILGGVLDNVCNSACQSCSARLSTKIGSLSGKSYFKINNSTVLSQLPLERVVELDINGGEPTASLSYQNLLEQLPDNVRIIRVNTNGSRVLPSLDRMLARGVKVIVTLSLDGVGNVHNYVRWPITWDQYQRTVMTYVKYRDNFPGLDVQAWTTLHALNAADLLNIKHFCDNYHIDHSWGFLVTPSALDSRFNNDMTLHAQKILASGDAWAAALSSQLAVRNNNQACLDEYVSKQDSLRGITIKDFI